MKDDGGIETPVETSELDVGIVKAVFIAEPLQMSLNKKPRIQLI